MFVFAFPPLHSRLGRLTWPRSGLMAGLVLAMLVSTPRLKGGLITYRVETRDDRFEPWGTDDPSFSPDPLSTLGPPLSPLALFPSLWQRHHPGNAIARHMLKAREEAPLVKGVTLPPLEQSPRSDVPGPWMVKRDLEKTYNDLIGVADSTPKAGESIRSAPKTSPPKASPPQDRSGPAGQSTGDGDKNSTN